MTPDERFAPPAAAPTDPQATVDQTRAWLARWGLYGALVAGALLLGLLPVTLALWLGAVSETRSLVGPASAMAGVSGIVMVGLGCGVWLWRHATVLEAEALLDGLRRWWVAGVVTALAGMTVAAAGVALGLLSGGS